MFKFDWQRYTKLYIIIVTAALLGASFLAGAMYGYENRPGIEKIMNVAGKETPPQLSNVDFNLFWDVWSRLEEKYVDRAKIDRQKMVFGAIEGLTRSVKDPYTEFFSPEQTKLFQDDIRGSFDGIGAEIGLKRSILTIIAPLKNSPAERAGLKPGDKILKIGDTPTADLGLDEAVRLIRGPKGTEVTLTIFRDSFDTTKDIKVVRDTITINVLTTEFKPNVDGEKNSNKNDESAAKSTDGIFVIKLNHFTENASVEFRRAVQEFYRTDSKKMVFDLRNNPGGFLQVAVDITSWFLPAGEVVARERYADGSEDLYRSSGYRLLEAIPTVVLINEGSASASEIVAGALRDARGIKLVGKKSFGKGSVQEVISLPKESSLKVTIAKWLTPKGIEINGKGLEPDITVEIPTDESQESKNNSRDPVMQKAIELLREMK